MIRKILFPVNFSSSYAASIGYVKRAAAIFGAEVALIHVCDPNRDNGFELYAGPSNEIAEEHWNLAQSELQLFLESEFPAKSCPRILLAGDAMDANPLTFSSKA